MKSISNDWDKFLLDVGYSKRDVEHYMANVIDTPEFNVMAGEVIDVGSQACTKAVSSTHGEGMFATKDIKKGEIIGVVVGYKEGIKYRSYLGRYTNHSILKNTKFEMVNNEVLATCLRDINVGEEILVDYRDHWGKW